MTKHIGIKAALILSAPSLSAAPLQAGDVAHDDGLPPIDLNHAVRFTVPTVVRPAVRYTLSVTFAGDFEQNVDVYVWANDTNTTGRWQRRAFVNNYWQGTQSVSTLVLDSGRSYALLMHRIDSRAPAYGKSFFQSNLLKVDPPADAPDTLPTVRAEFASGQTTATVVDLRPAVSPPR